MESDSQSAIPKSKSGLGGVDSGIGSTLSSSRLGLTISSCLLACIFELLVHTINQLKYPYTLVHYAKYCTWVWSRVLITHSAAPRALSASRPHPRTIFRVMYSAGTLTSI